MAIDLLLLVTLDRADLHYHLRLQFARHALATSYARGDIDGLGDEGVNTNCEPPPPFPPKLLVHFTPPLIQSITQHVGHQANGEQVVGICEETNTGDDDSTDI